MMPDLISSFRGAHSFLSNFYLCRLRYKVPGTSTALHYDSVEHAYQAAKATSVDDRQFVREQVTPGRAKRAGRQIAIRPDWDEIKLSVMEDCLKCKFKNPRLRSWLLATRDMELIEGNTWGDTYWGQCPLGNGFNHLGMLLMKVREELRT